MTDQRLGSTEGVGTGVPEEHVQMTSARNAWVHDRVVGRSMTEGALHHELGITPLRAGYRTIGLPERGRIGRLHLLHQRGVL